MTDDPQPNLITLDPDPEDDETEDDDQDDQGDDVDPPEEPTEEENNAAIDRYNKIQGTDY
jgi:hypothetical protein